MTNVHACAPPELAAAPPAPPITAATLRGIVAATLATGGTDPRVNVIMTVASEWAAAGGPP